MKPRTEQTQGSDQTVLSRRDDRFDIDIHGVMGMTHLDTPAHFFFKKHGFAGSKQPDLKFEPFGAAALQPFVRGMVGRGVLIDIPRLLGRRMLPGEAVTPDGLDRAVEREGLNVSRADLLFLRYGRTPGLRSDMDIAAGIPGLSVLCTEWIARHAPSVVVTDYGFDVVPGEVPDAPVGHMLMLVALGIPLVDAATLEELAAVCERLGRWQFFASIAPLDIPHASGSPVNPLAIF